MPLDVADSLDYFRVLAGVSATLLALSFVALNFFLDGLFKRHQALRLPVIREEDRAKRAAKAEGTPVHAKIWHVTDFRLFDGDPLVVFVAFSVAVTWSLYFISLLTSVTASVAKFSHPIVFAVELDLFGAMLIWDFVVRQRQYKRLRTYRTREEHFWQPYAVLVSVVYGGLALFALSAAIPASATLWSRAGIDSTELLIWILRGACPFALFSALYFTNHDYFVFFKARISDEVRQRWLSQFVDKAYEDLQGSVSAALKKGEEIPDKAAVLETLRTVWNDGLPADPECFKVSLEILNAKASPWQQALRRLREPRVNPKTRAGTEGFTAEDVWHDLFGTPGRTIAAWMVDVPKISDWADRVAELVDGIDRGHPGAEAVSGNAEPSSGRT